jgi:signal peptide peptidase SppA
MSKLYAILPEFAVEWERRKIEALHRMPRAELKESTRKEIEDFMDENREFVRQYYSMMFNQRQPMRIEQGVAVIHIHDYLIHEPTFLDECMGASSYGAIAKDLAVAEANASVKAVLLNVNSGGGSAVGCVEVGKMVVQLDTKKPVYAHAEVMCCSAAYAIACGARAIYSADSSMMGSIGTIMTVMEMDRMLQEAGIGVHVFTNKEADLKGMGSDVKAPSEAQEQRFQEMADEYGSQFLNHVMDRREKADMNAMRGQALSGRESVKAQLTDGILGFGQLLEMLQLTPG